MFEDLGSGEGVIWYSVIGVERPNYLLLFGYMAPPFGGPATGYLRIALTKKTDDETLLELIDTACGHLPSYDAAAGWREVFEQNFARYVGRAPAKKAKR